jgi:hypothetical protein
MADTTTTNYGWVKPEISASNDTWGTKLNTNFDNIDSKVKTLDIITAAAKATPVDADYIGLYDSAAGFVAKKMTYAQFKTSLDTRYLNASNLNAGTVPDARISGAYDGFTAITASSILTLNVGNGEAIRIAGALATDDPYMTFYKNGVRQAFIQHNDGTGNFAGLRIINDITASDTQMILTNDGGVSGFRYAVGATAYEVWHSGNDGSGSGLDADTLRGQAQTSLNTASTVMARDANGDTNVRLIKQEYNVTTASNAYFIGQVALGAGADNYLRPMTIAQAAALLDSALVPVGRTITAGNGLTGGGDLSANRTVTLGTPGTISNTSTNNVSSTSHQHALDQTYAAVYTGTTSGNTNFPIGTVIAARGLYPVRVRNSTLGVALYTGDTGQFILSDAGTGVGTALSGTWAFRGLAWGDGSVLVMLMQRIS